MGNKTQHSAELPAAHRRGDAVIRDKSVTTGGANSIASRSLLPALLRERQTALPGFESGVCAPAPAESPSRTSGLDGGTQTPA
jgi:hypothetical protein